MPLVMNNFVRTSTRAPIAPEDTSIQLAPGSGVFFNIPAGSYCYITVNDATKAEVMKYISSGTVVDDVITVVRAQDNTTAQAFNAGVCVAEAWNVAQVRDFTQQLIDGTPTPNNTMVVDGVPVLPPLVNIHYAIDINTGQLWYYATVDASGVPLLIPHWVIIVSNGTIMLTSAPTSPPPGGITWAINTASNALYYYTGSSWLLISSFGGSGLLESLGRQYLNSPTGVNLTPATYTFSGMQQTPLNLTFDVVTSYKANPAAVNIIFVPTTGTNAFKIEVFANCIFQLDVAVWGEATTPASALEMYLTATHTLNATAFGTSIYRPAGSSVIATPMTLSTGPLTLGPISSTVPDVWDANLLVVGPSAFTLVEARITASMLVLL